MYHSVLNPNNEPLFRCNNCDLEAPIEELRVFPPKGFHFSSYYTIGGRTSPGSMHRIPMEMLLCHQCIVEFRKWTESRGIGKCPSSRIFPDRPSPLVPVTD